jgi:hypothetical protein
MALDIVRLKPEEDYDMRTILVAKYRYYLDPSTGKVYKRGDKDMPPGVRLLAAKGSPVEPNVAEEYDIETEEAQDVARVPSAAVSAPRDRGLGSSEQAEAGYRRIERTGAIQREVAPLIAGAGLHGAGAAAQLGLHAETQIKAATQEAADEGEPGAEMLARQQMGTNIQGAERSAAIVRQLEEGEREALATHKAQIDTRAEEIKEGLRAEADEEDEGDETSRRDPTGGSPNEASTSDTSGAPRSRTREIKPAGSASKGARGGSKRGAKGGSKGSTAS